MLAIVGNSSRGTLVPITTTEVAKILEAPESQLQAFKDLFTITMTEFTQSTSLAIQGDRLIEVHSDFLDMGFTIHMSKGSSGAFSRSMTITTTETTTVQMVLGERFWAEAPAELVDLMFPLAEDYRKNPASWDKKKILFVASKFAKGLQLHMAGSGIGSIAKDLRGQFSALDLPKKVDAARIDSIRQNRKTLAISGKF
jgi:hypothetical protein